MLTHGFFNRLGTGSDGTGVARFTREAGNQFANQPDPAPVPAAPDMIVIEPAHHLTFGEPPEVQGIMFDPDGVTAYVHLHAQSINVWDMLLSVMPWIMLAVGVIVILITLRVGYRRIKDKDIVGRFYCGKCGYELQTQEPRCVCPECGVDPADRTPRAGKRLLRRLALPVVTVVITLIVGSVASVASQWAPKDVLSWPSQRLAEMAVEKGWSRLDPFLRKGDWIRRFNLETGQFGRTVLRRSSLTYGRMTVSPDGSSFYRFSYRGAGPRVERINIASGRAVGRLPLPDGSRAHIHASLVISHERDGKDAMVFYMHEPTKKHRLIRWDIETDTHTVVFEEQAWVPGSGYPVERVLIPVSPETGGVYLSTPTFMESYDRRLHEFRLLDASGTIVRTIERTGYGYDGGPVVTQDGQWMFNLGTYGAPIIADNPSTGESRGTLSLEDPLQTSSTLTMAPDDRHLLLSYESVYVRDIRAKRWVAKLVGAEGTFAAEPFLSADARWHAVVSQRRPTAAEAARGVQYAHDLVIWDVSQLGMGADGSER